MTGSIPDTCAPSTTTQGGLAATPTRSVPSLIFSSAPSASLGNPQAIAVTAARGQRNMIELMARQKCKCFAPRSAAAGCTVDGSSTLVRSEVTPSLERAAKKNGADLSAPFSRFWYFARDLVGQCERYAKAEHAVIDRVREGRDRQSGTQH